MYIQCIEVFLLVSRSLDTIFDTTWRMHFDCSGPLFFIVNVAFNKFNAAVVNEQVNKFENRYHAAAHQ